MPSAWQPAAVWFRRAESGHRRRRLPRLLSRHTCGAGRCKCSTACGRACTRTSSTTTCSAPPHPRASLAGGPALGGVYVLDQPVLAEREPEKRRLVRVDEERAATAPRNGGAPSGVGRRRERPRPLATWGPCSTAIPTSAWSGHGRRMVPPRGGAGRNPGHGCVAALGSHQYSADAGSPDRAQRRGVRRRFRGSEKEPA
jgi:hypothetical protein